MIEDFRDGRPAEYAAFYTIGQFITGDIRAAALVFLDRGYDGEYITSCAFDLPSKFESEDVCFKKALLETGLPRLPTVRESIWLALRYYLIKTVEHSDEVGVDLVCKMINLERDWGDVELFLRPDCDLYFEEQKKKCKFAGSKFAAQQWGIENLLGIYYSKDDWSYSANKSKMCFDDWHHEQTLLQAKEIIEEAQRVKNKYFSLESDLPAILTNVGEFL